MQDRIVEHPNRYRLVKVPGTTDTYDLAPAPGEVTQEGTVIGKSTLLSDDTAALFGFGEEAVPDDVLRTLSRFQAGLGNEHIWRKYAAVYEPLFYQPLVAGSSVIFGTYNDGYATHTVYYADSIDNNGNLINPQTVTVSGVTYTNANVLIGKYWQIPINGPVRYSSPDAKVSTTGDFNAQIKLTYSSEVFGMQMIRTDTSYVNSPYPNAYPPEVDDGFTYEYLGQMGERARIATGSYMGTGTYSNTTAGNENTLTFDFEPKVVFVVGVNAGATLWMAKGAGYAASIVSENIYPISLAWSGNSVTWYNANNANNQLNQNGRQYNYIAIG